MIHYALLYNITQHRYTTFPNVFTDSHLVVWVVDSKTLVGGRAVVETKVIDHRLKHCAITPYTIVVVEWSKFSEN